MGKNMIGREVMGFLDKFLEDHTAVPIWPLFDDSKSTTSRFLYVLIWAFQFGFFPFPDDVSWERALSRLTGLSLDRLASELDRLENWGVITVDNGSNKIWINDLRDVYAVEGEVNLDYLERIKRSKMRRLYDRLLEVNEHLRIQSNEKTTL